jgi:hypothetical protein
MGNPSVIDDAFNETFYLKLGKSRQLKRGVNCCELSFKQIF